MCIWSDKMIEKWGVDGGIKPYNPTQLNPASFDLRLSSEFIDLHSGTRFDVVGDSITIAPGHALLASTIEYITMPGDAAGVLYLKSSIARRGVDHALAGWVDPGFEGQLTLEIHVHRKLRLIPGQRFIQLALMTMCEKPRQLYRGRYQKQKGPTPAKGRV